MLVLSRKVNEVLVIGQGETAVRVVVLSVQGDQVKLGIEAPRAILVMREEVLAAQTENRRAADSVSPDELTALTGEGPKPPSPPPSSKSR